ncbi:unnamed protein product [Toxocara canis]|uniref:Tim44 domain-containing protein n=1 Tax=Toxocara canis TaxID=6265 RepID=A0A183UIP2_TOXCA|nr:unnamed protein product [Toxocara canis]
MGYLVVLIAATVIVAFFFIIKKPQNMPRTGQRESSKVKWARGHAGKGKGRDKRIFQRLSNEIVLDSNVLQSIANDIAKGSNPVNKDVIGEDVTRKLVDVGHQSSREAEIEKGKLDKLCNEPIVVSETAAKIVDRLISKKVLDRILTQDEDEVLAVLDTIMDKILTHAFEFCGDKAELEAFLENRQQAKASLLDAFIARRARLDALARSPSHLDSKAAHKFELWMLTLQRKNHGPKPFLWKCDRCDVNVDLVPVSNELPLEV